MTSGPTKSLEWELPETLQAELERSGKGASWGFTSPTGSWHVTASHLPSTRGRSEDGTAQHTVGFQ